ncbi:beta-ketoacyl synthase N-terminal-like domain-containing protein [Hyphomonas sp.]|uniref:beta-ketoacyl synthase N-terminal-like domain-containing protein n=1 Tax=Hyphomonas sp. TaxID=87 RepID=UPI000C461E96|nr:beta-ketoacyl synthase N-terminal-like domain-containing protein [Hyphomonas sp.]MAU66910.1 3-oxoacyl-ACP reductase [Hyphomonas sp.]
MAKPSAAPIAIVGLGAVFPGRGDVTGFWRDLFEGSDLITDVPPTHWLIDDYYDEDPKTKDRTYGRRGGFIDPLAFDPLYFGIPPKAMEGTDTAQLLALIAAQMTLEDIERDSGGMIDKSRTSIVLGVASATEMTAHMAGRLQRPAWVNAMRQAGLAESQVQDIAARISDHYVDWQEATFPGLLGNVIAGRIANRFDLTGSNYVTDAACASSLSALQIALHELRSGDSDTVLTGGVDALNDILMYMCFSKTPALSTSGDCRPFSTRADGTMLGEGIGMLALRRLDDAERDGNHIYALIKGLGGASDGKGTAIYSPVPHGQARALKRAYDQAGYNPSTVDLVEAHGTGTKAGDKAEIEGLHLVFGEYAADEPWCAVGSVKAQIGHTKAAAGSASLIKVTHALSRKILPPTIKVEEPADAIKTSPVFYLNTEARPWISPKKRPRRASVSSFGFGGSNFHVTLEEYTGPNAAKPWRSLPSELFLFSADSPETLAAKIESSLPVPTESELAYRAWQSQDAFDCKAPARAAIVACNPAELSEKASAIVDALRRGEIGKRPLKMGCHVSLDPPTDDKVAFMFSGQGSQYVGMGSDLAMGFPAARSVWDQAAGHKRAGDLKLHMLAFPPAAFDQVEHGDQTDRLKAMEHAQPAIAAVALAQLSLLEQAGITADMTAGHSFGEIMALHYGGTFNLASALTAAVERGALMAEAASSTAGSMMAVQAGAEDVGGLLQRFSPDLVLANDNGPSQIVLSGPSGIIREAIETCTQEGLKARALPVATAFHSQIVASAVKPFEAALTKLRPRKPSLPVYANATAKPYTCTAAQMPTEIAGQLESPVRFRELVEQMYRDGARTFIEVGPGSVVSGLVDDVLGSRPHTAYALDNKRVNGVTQFLSTLGALSVSGLAINFAGLFDDLPAEPPRPAPPKHAVMISGANYGKPYPPPEGAAGRAAPNPEKSSSPTETKPVAQPPRTAQPEFKSSPSFSASSSQEPAMPDSSYSSFPSLPPYEPSGSAGETPAERVMMEVSRRHADFLKIASSAHAAYLNTVAQVMSGKGAVQNEPAKALPEPPASPAPVPRQVEPVAASAAPTPYPVATRPAPPAVAPASTPVSKPAAFSSPIADAAPPPPAKPARTEQVDAVALVRAIIADKTGYPEDMLDADMDLEGELGVDSIKQVEILSTLREELPDLPEIDPERLVELRTISAIAEMVSGAAGASTPPPVAKPTPQQVPASTAPSPASGNGSITTDIVRDLIADKTGYPSDMLEDDMDLEGELGVDSIKQVEILSALRDQHPDLPEVDPEVLVELRTIRKIADFFA